MGRPPKLAGRLGVFNSSNPYLTVNIPVKVASCIMAAGDPKRGERRRPFVRAISAAARAGESCFFWSSDDARKIKRP